MLEPAAAGPGWAIIKGDSFKVLPLLRSDLAAMVLTDPPYDDHVHETFGHRDKRNGFRSSEAIPFAALSDVDGLVAELLRLTSGWALAFCALEQLGDYKRAAGPCYLRSGLWRKPNGIPQFTGDRPAIAAEGIACMFDRSGEMKPAWLGKGKHGIWTCDKPPSRANRHPTEKPPKLIRELIADFIGPGDGGVILDPFAGSGAVGIAALSMGYRYLGIELDEHDRFIADAAERLEAASGGPLFGGGEAMDIREFLRGGDDE